MKRFELMFGNKQRHVESRFDYLSTEYQYDDLFIYAPSFVLAESGVLMEGKALATARKEDLMLAQRLGKSVRLDPGLGTERKTGQTVGKRKLKTVQKRLEPQLNQLVANYQVGKISAGEFKKHVTKAMKIAWRDVFQAGLRAGGSEGLGAGKGRPIARMGPGDDVWLKGAMRHEMQFLNRFVEAVVSEDFIMPLPRRVKMYVDTLSGFYDSARVIALPGNILINWVGPNNKLTCPGCQYLFKLSPFTKFTLPTTPRSGDTPCLSQCRDRLFVRRVPTQQVDKREAELPYTRGTMMKHLRKIKRTGKPI